MTRTQTLPAAQLGVSDVIVYHNADGEPRRFQVNGVAQRGWPTLVVYTVSLDSGYKGLRYIDRDETLMVERFER